MAEASTKKQKKRLRQAADFPPPKQLSQEQVSEICATLRISDRHTVQIKDFLDHLVDEIDWKCQEMTCACARAAIADTRHHGETRVEARIPNSCVFIAR